VDFHRTIQRHFLILSALLAVLLTTDTPWGSSSGTANQQKTGTSSQEGSTQIGGKTAIQLHHEGLLYFRRAQDSRFPRDLYQKALELFKKASDTRKSPFSLFYIAACYYELGKQDEALKALKDFARTYADDDKYAPLAYQKMALIYAKQGNINEAKKALDSISSMKGDVYKDFALLEYGKLLEKEGKSDEAKKKYTELVQKFPNSPFKDEVAAKLSGKKEG